MNGYSGPERLNLQRVLGSPADPDKTQILIPRGLGWGLGVCISNEHPGDADLTKVRDGPGFHGVERRRRGSGGGNK